MPTTEKDIRGLIKNEKERPINVPAEQVVEHLMGKTEQLVNDFQFLYNQFLNTLDKRTKSLKLEPETQVAAIGQAVAEVKKAVVVVDAAADKIPPSVPVKGEVHGFTNWKSAVVVAVVSALLGVLLVLVFSSKVSKADYEQLQAQEQQAVKANVELQKQGNYYLKQIKSYKA